MQEQSSLAAFRADLQAQLDSSQAQVNELRSAARAAQSADRQGKQVQADLQAVNNKLQVLPSAQ